MKIHPVFYNSLLKPYHKTKEHSPNHEKPTPEIVNGKEGHYEIEAILMAQPTQNRKSMQYLIKWKGYPASENSWLPEKELTNAKELLDKLLRFYPHFSTFLTHVTSRALSFPRHLPRAPSMCLQIMGFIFAYVALTCIILFAHILIWFLTAVPRLLITFL
jgi:hypothetical protein